MARPSSIVATNGSSRFIIGPPPPKFGPKSDPPNLKNTHNNWHVTNNINDSNGNNAPNGRPAIENGFQKFAGKQNQHHQQQHQQQRQQHQHRSRSVQKSQHGSNFNKPTGPPSMNGDVTSHRTTTTVHVQNQNQPGHVNPFKKPIGNVPEIGSVRQHTRSSSRASESSVKSFNLKPIEPESFKNWKEMENPQSLPHYISPLHKSVVPAFNAGPLRVVTPPMPTKMHFKPAVNHSSEAPTVLEPSPISSVVVVPAAAIAPAAIKPVVSVSQQSLSFCEFPTSNSQVMITDVISAKQVFVRSVNEALDDEYLTTLAYVALYASTKAKPLVAQPLDGQMILAPNPQQKSQLRRALVLKTIGISQLLVAFIDFGSVVPQLLADCRDLSSDLQLRRRLVHRCNIDDTTTTIEQLNQLKASPMLITYEEPFKPSSLVKLSLV